MTGKKSTRAKSVTVHGLYFFLTRTNRTAKNGRNEAVAHVAHLGAVGVTEGWWGKQRA